MLIVQIELGVLVFVGVILLVWLDRGWARVSTAIAEPEEPDQTHKGLASDSQHKTWTVISDVAPPARDWEILRNLDGEWHPIGTREWGHPDLARAQREGYQVRPKV